MVKRLAAIALALLALAASAHADSTLFATGFEFGTLWPVQTGGTQTLFDAVSSTAPTIVAIDSGGDVRCNYESWNYGQTCTANTDCGSTALCTGGACSHLGTACTTNTDCTANTFANCRTDTNNDFEMKLAPTSGTDRYVELSTSYLSVASGQLNAHFALNVKTIPAPGSVYEIAELGSGSGRYGTLQILGYGSCSNSATSRCTSNTDCSSGVACAVDGTDSYDVRYFPPDVPAATATPIHNECSGGTNPGVTCTSCSSNSDCSGACADGIGSGICYNPGANQGACCDDCNAGHPGEQWCLPSCTASTSNLKTGNRYELMFGVEDDPSGSAAYQAKFTFYVGGYEVGSTTKDLRACNAGTPALLCTSNTDCTLGGSCAVQGISVPTKLRIGQSGTTPAIGGTWDIRVDDIVVSDNDTASRIAALRIQDLVPNTSTNVDSFTATAASVCSQTCSEGTNEYQCIDEANCQSVGYNGSDYVLTPTGTSTQNDWYALTNLSQCTTNTDCGGGSCGTNNDCASGSKPTNGDQPGQTAGTILGIAAMSVMADDSTGANGTAQDSGAIVCPSVSAGTCAETADAGSTEVKVERVTNVNQDGTLVPGGYSFIDDSTAATFANINGAGVKLETGPGCTQSCQVRFAATEAEAVIQRRLGTLPGIAADVNEDGTKRLCVVGDSTVDQTGMRNLIISGLRDFDSMQFCTYGGTTIGDVQDQLTSILDGTTSGGTMNCRYFKGSAGPCDYMVMVNAHNTLDNIIGLMPRKYCSAGTSLGDVCSTNTDCAGNADCAYYPNGYCRGGANDGKACDCPMPRHNRDQTYYCTNRRDSDAIYLSSTNTDVTNCAVCTDNTDCISTKTCATNSDCGIANVCGASLGTNLCWASNYLGFTSDACTVDGDCVQPTCNTGLGLCTNLCQSSQCVISYVAPSDGALVPPPTDAYGHKWALPGCANSTSCPSGLCWSMNTEAEAQREFEAIVSGIEARTGSGVGCTSCRAQLIVGIQPPGTVTNPTLNRNESYGAFLRDYVKQHPGVMFIDIASAFRLSSGQANYAGGSDPIHWSSTGYATAWAKILAAMTNVSGPSDGTCTAGVCTTGAVGQQCERCSDDGHFCNDNTDCAGTCDQTTEPKVCQDTGAECTTNTDCAGTCQSDNKACATYQCDMLVPDWKAAANPMWGFDGVCVNGTDPWDDCSSNTDCSGGTCDTVAATTAELRDRSAHGNVLAAGTGTVTYGASADSLGTNQADFDVAEYLTCSAANCPTLNVAANQSRSWGGRFNISTNQATDEYVMSRMSGTANGYRMIRTTSSTSPTLQCEVRLANTQIIDSAAAGTFTGSVAHSAACVYTYNAGAVETVEAFLDGASNGATNGVGTLNFNGTQAPIDINSRTTANDWAGSADEVWVIPKAIDAARVNRIVSGQLTGDLVDCDSFTAANYTACDSNTDCGSTQLCDTGAGALDDTYCVEGSSAGCCMGLNSTRAAGAAMPACNAVP